MKRNRKRSVLRICGVMALAFAVSVGWTAWPSATPTTTFTSMKERLWFLRRETYFYIQYALVTRFIRMPTLVEARLPRQL